jgi:hypothetical protein
MAGFITGHAAPSLAHHDVLVATLSVIPSALSSLTIIIARLALMSLGAFVLLATVA